MPDRHSLKGNMRIAGHNRLARLGARASQHPIIAPAELIRSTVSAVVLVAMTARIFARLQNAFVIGLANQEVAIELAIAQGSLHQLGDADDRKAAGEIPAKIADDGEAV